MRKLFLVSLASLIFAACGGSDSSTTGSPGAVPIGGTWDVSGAMTGTIILAESGREQGKNGATATLYSGSFGSQAVTARQAFVNNLYDTHFTMQIGATAADATMQDAAHFNGTANGAAFKGVLAPPPK